MKEEDVFDEAERGISKKLGIEDQKEDLEVKVEECTFDSDHPDKDVVEDYIFIRKKLRYSVAACESVLGAALRDMANNPSARCVEGCSAIIKTITECTNQLLLIHEKRSKIISIISPPKNDNKNGDKNEEEDKGIAARVDEILASFEEKEEVE